VRLISSGVRETHARFSFGQVIIDAERTLAAFGVNAREIVAVVFNFVGGSVKHNDERARPEHWRFDGQPSVKSGP
jgi:hypothetical protein